MLIELVWGRGERVPGNGNAGNSPIRFQRVSDYDPFLDTDSLRMSLFIGTCTFALTIIHRYMYLHVNHYSQVHVPSC